MNERTKPRSSVKKYQKDGIVGYRSKSFLNSEGFIEGLFLIKTKDGKLFQEYGYSRKQTVRGSEEDLIEDARLNASSKVMYREGYFVGRENYENLDQDKIESVELQDFTVYYFQSRNKEFNSYGEYKRGNKTIVAERDQFGRFKSHSSKSDGDKFKKDFNEVNN